MFEENELNDAMRMIVRWFSSSSEWFELDAQAWKMEVELRSWENENAAFSDNELSFNLEFQFEWI